MNAFIAIAAMLSALGVLSVLAHWFIPRLTRPDQYFAVTVSAGLRDSSDGRAILRRYRRELLAMSVPALALLVALTVMSRLA